ncbi:MAG: TrkH family potassium uptake protein, partial [Planctomycetes bacterium]|nr:TrkH family potassium uptake protein [Planctomycetota bacterium]
MSFSCVLHVLGRLCLVFAGLLLVPLIMVFIDGDGPVVSDAALTVSAAFGWASAASAALGLVLIVLFRLDKNDFDREEGFAVVTFSWILFMLLGALPFILSGAIPDVVDALFETLSGFTTTGASILSDPALLGRPLLFWRALTHWVGGMGIVALSVAILPTLGAGGAFLYRAEGSDPDRGNLFPRVADVARQLWMIYIGLTLAEVLSLTAAGMDVFEAICHSFATVATGGFGTRADSYASYSPTIQWVTTLFMFLSGLNLLLLAAAARGRPMDLFRNTETRVWIAILLVAIVLGVAVLHDTPQAPAGFEPLVRSVSFTVVSVCSTTGFATADFGMWPVGL